MFESMQNWALVRLFSKWFSSETLSRWVQKIMGMVENDQLKSAAFNMFKWAIFLIILCTLIDWGLYWSAPEQRVQALRFMAGFRALVKKAKARLGLGTPGGNRNR